ncbi:MAG TPA: sigma factor [Pirellulales bacterium]|jgi:RNA polymerase sigma-70 factor (ECF subfamily)|nr:sigma factor [Pirellulales bacterium]
MNSGPAQRFPTTAWSVIRAAQDHDGPEHLAAINRLMAAYWRPVFYFLRARRYPLERAEDLTQDFFVAFYERDWIRRADPERGRFRTLLLTILTRFLADQSDQRAPRQRVFDDRLVTISVLLGESDRNFEPPDNRTPEEVFMHEWARSVIASVQQCLETWCSNRGRPDWYQIFCQLYLPSPGSPHLSQQALAEQLRLTRDQVRYGLEEVNRQFVELLRAEVAGQVGSDENLDTEIRELERLLTA